MEKTEKSIDGGKKIDAKKILAVAGNVLLYVVLALALFTIIVTITAKKDDDGTATVFGYQLRFVQSDSMGKCDLVDVSGYKIKSIPVRSCVFVKAAPENDKEKDEWYKTIEVGDVLTFKYVFDTQRTVTHRVTKIEKKNNGFVFTLQGDNRTTEDGVTDQIIDTTVSDSVNYIIGKVTGQSYPLGLVVYAFKQPVGIILIVIVPCLIIIAFQAMRIVKVVNVERKEKAEEVRSAQQSEIDELKRQLELLKGNAAVPAMDAEAEEFAVPAANAENEEKDK